MVLYGVFLKMSGRVLAGLGLLNLARKSFDIGLYGVIRDIVAWYNDYFLVMISPITEFARYVMASLNLTIPDHFEDFLVLYAIFGAANLRTISVLEITFVLKPSVDRLSHKLALAADMLVRLLLWPIHVFFAPISFIYDYITIRFVFKGNTPIDVLVWTFLGQWRRSFLNFVREFSFVALSFFLFLAVNTGFSYVDRRPHAPGVDVIGTAPAR